MSHKIITWQCKKCNEIIQSDSREHHKMDFCKCGNIGVDLEEDYCRWSTNNQDDIIIIKESEVENMVEERYYKELPEALQPIVKEMCKRVKVPVTKINFTKPQWFMDYTWTAVQQEKFVNWLADWFYNLPVSKKRELNKNTNKTKKNAFKFAWAVVLNYGWKTKE